MSEQPRAELLGTIIDVEDDDSSTSATTVVSQQILTGYELVRETLFIYQEITGDLLVPKRFIIPLEDDRFPVGMRGRSLGNIVYAIRNKDAYKEHKEELIAMGFDYTNCERRIDFNTVKETLLVYQEIYGNLSIPVAYIIPVEEERFPKKIRGKAFGKMIVKIRNNHAFKEHKEELIAMGLEIYENSKALIDFELIKQSLIVYKERYGDLLVPKRFIIPIDDEAYPIKMRGKLLGRMVSKIRNNNTHKNHKEELIALGFDYHKQHGEFELVKASLIVYQEIYGDLLVPRSYSIPIDDIRYPERMRGRSLGTIVCDIRNNVAYKKYHDELIAIGFDFFSQKRRGDFELLKESLLAFKEIHGDLLVPKMFVIPIHDERYPEGMRGKYLGRIVYNIKNCDHYKKYKEELIAIGFDYGIQLVDYEIVKEGLLAYKEIHGDLFVPRPYMIPLDDIRYPERLREKSLGSIVYNIRNNEYYHEHKDELIEMGFEFGKRQYKRNKRKLADLTEDQ